MQSYVFQDWTTIRSSNATLVQSSMAWLDLQPYSDIVFTIDTREVTNPGSGTVQLALETSPTADDVLFSAMGTVTLTPGTSGVVLKVLLSQSPAVPLARYVRWRLTGTQAGTWDATFRVVASVGRAPAAFMPVALSGCTLWLRGDLGVTNNGGTCSQWSDQSPTGAVFIQGTKANQPSLQPGINGKQTLRFNGTSTQMTTTTTNSSFLSASAYTAFCVFNYTGTVAAQTNSYQNPTLIMDITAGYWGMLCCSSVAIGYDWDGADENVRVGITTGRNYYLMSQLSAGTLYASVNGGTPGTHASGNIQNLNWPPSIGAPYSVAGNYHQGDIAEIVVYNRALSASEIATVQGYLSGMWGI